MYKIDSYKMLHDENKEISHDQAISYSYICISRIATEQR